MIVSSDRLGLCSRIIANRDLSEIEVEREFRLQITAQLVGDNGILALFQKHEAIVQNRLQLLEFLVVKWRRESFEKSFLFVQRFGLVYLKIQNL